MPTQQCTPLTDWQWHTQQVRAWESAFLRNWCAFNAATATAEVDAANGRLTATLLALREAEDEARKVGVCVPLAHETLAALARLTPVYLKEGDAA